MSSKWIHIIQLACEELEGLIGGEPTPSQPQPVPAPQSQIGGTSFLNGLQPQTFSLGMKLIDYAHSQGLSFNFISGLRSLDQQRQMQKNWDSGNRAGLAVRPADNSAHVTGEAFDISASADTLSALGQYALTQGAVWGGTFVPSDPGHFSTRKGG